MILGGCGALKLKRSGRAILSHLNRYMPLHGETNNITHLFLPTFLKNPPSTVPWFHQCLLSSYRTVAPKLSFQDFEKWNQINTGVRSRVYVSWLTRRRRVTCMTWKPLVSSFFFFFLKPIVAVPCNYWLGFFSFCEFFRYTCLRGQNTKKLFKMMWCM